MTQILLAEDDRISRVMLQAVLQKWGYRVVSVADGQQALDRLLDPQGPSLAILDWMMPGLTGVDVCRRIRSQVGLRPVYLLLLTSKSKGGEAAEALAAGADEHVSKPYNLVELQARIEMGLRRIRELAPLPPVSGAVPKSVSESPPACSARCHPLFMPLNRIALGVVLEQPDLLDETAHKSGHCDLDVAIQTLLLHSRKLLRGRVAVAWRGGSSLVSVGSEVVGQILLNLLIELRGQAELDAACPVEITERRDGQWALVEVASDGPDYSRVDMDALLALDPGTTKSVHPGFGFAFARAAAQAAGGDLAATARSGGGLRFEIRLPLSV